MPRENLDQYLDAYRNDPFEHENDMMLNAYVTRCIKYSANRESYLELGIGHGIVLRELSAHFKRVLVLEGALTLVREYADKYENVEVRHIFFEDYETEERFDCIGMGFVLEHVDDPVLLLRKFRGFLTDRGSILIGVPSASSLHRILAVKAGLLDDIRRMSDADMSYGHKRFLTYQDWLAVLEQAGLHAVRAEGLYLKPFASAQIKNLALDPKVFDALVEVARDYPAISNTLFLEAKNV